MARDGVKQPIGGRSVASDVEAEFRRLHALARCADPVSLDTTEGEVDVLLISEEVEELLADVSSL